MKFHHQRFVFGTNWPDDDWSLVFQFPRRDVLHRIRADGRPWQFVFRRFQVVQNDARVERENPLRRNEQRIDVNFRDPRLFNDKLAEADEQMFEFRDVRRFAPAHALERGENFCAFHHAPRERGVERRQTERAVLENFHELAARSEKQNGSELRVHTAADDQFIPFKLHHPLHGDAEKMFRANFFGDGSFD